MPEDAFPKAVNKPEQQGLVEVAARGSLFPIHGSCGGGGKRVSMRASEPSRKVRLHSATLCEVNFLQTMDRLALHQSRVLLGGAQG